MPCYDTSIYESRLTQRYHFINLMRISMFYNQRKTATSTDCTIKTNKQVLNILHKA